MEYVTNVIDGDTFETSSGHPRVRLANVNTPERGAPGYAAAKNALTRLVLNKYVTIQTNAHDVYGRRVAHVWVGSTHVNAIMKQYSR
ncbi:MAG: thermonuclease family protein [Bacteroidetes bacterium SB0662_bin_6]|nr:thermonuclease family protein [Bacteroidetes bacterium SB0668_bin_1]MYE03716.1 thermonuclease family protein [Bacteroidetes bacterium SB0662_bin_6]